MEISNPEEALNILSAAYERVELSLLNPRTPRPSISQHEATARTALEIFDQAVETIGGREYFNELISAQPSNLSHQVIAMAFLCDIFRIYLGPNLGIGTADIVNTLMDIISTSNKLQAAGWYRDEPDFLTALINLIAIFINHSREPKLHNYPLNPALIEVIKRNASLS